VVGLNLGATRRGVRTRTSYCDAGCGQATRIVTSGKHYSLNALRHFMFDFGAVGFVLRRSHLEQLSAQKFKSRNIARWAAGAIGPAQMSLKAKMLGELGSSRDHRGRGGLMTWVVVAIMAEEVGPDSGSNRNHAKDVAL
jgi:hypothetical protein